MKFIGLDGKEIAVAIKQSDYRQRSIESCKSKLQWHVGQDLRQLYPRYVLLEEWGIPNTRLSLDFFIPELRMAIEVDGIQHKKFSAFFHGNKKGFERSLARDAQKEEWCNINNITLVRVTRGENVRECIEKNIC